MAVQVTEQLVSLDRSTGSVDDWMPRIEAFLEPFRQDFPRADQWRWAAVYLQGLLRAGDRKSIGPLSQRVTLPPGLAVHDPAQALQNFISHSPWDEQRLWNRYRQVVLPSFASPRGVFAFCNLSFVKRGNQSVGVFRQPDGHGRKVNCQSVVSLHYVNGGRHLPVGLRLYLPQHWQAEPERLDRAGVPEAHRQPRRKWQIALDLLDEARAAGLPAQAVVADASFASADFRAGLRERGLPYLVEVPSEDALASLRVSSAEPFTRSWRPIEVARPGDAHAWFSLPASTEQILAVRLRDQGDRYAVTQFPEGSRGRLAIMLARARQLAETRCQEMRSRLGLDHFEGRSWRGFHHHACLVMLAHSLLQIG